MSVFGSVLRSMRIAKNLTQKELAQKLGLSFSTISMYERGDREPGLETMEKIADFFNVDMNYLYGKQSVPNRYQFDLEYSRTSQFTPHETDLVQAYRSHPEMQPAIDKMLDIAPAPSNQVELTTEAQPATEYVPVVAAAKVGGVIPLPPVDLEELERARATYEMTFDDN